MTGLLILRCGASEVAELGPGQTWQVDAHEQNAVATSGLSIDATTGSTGAAAIVTTWLG
jgi:hypothetical protein